MDAEKIARGIYMVGGSELSAPEDAGVFVIQAHNELILIDSGAGESLAEIEENIRTIGLDPARISTLVLTHCHVDHIG
ncbi:MAG: MBL fold metallo-hydrolase, partial [Bradymonadales bacterium]|nr:MBL fold metallo-hydrolase [Bradymonadales bacterium]